MDTQISGKEEKTLIWKNFDTCHGSWVHKFFTNKPGHESTFWRSYFLPYFYSVILFFVFPLIVAITNLPSVLNNSTDVSLPFLLDWNNTFMFIVTFPLIVSLLLSERNILSSNIAQVVSEDIIIFKDIKVKKFIKIWENKYKKYNIGFQVLGFLIGITALVLNYNLFMSDNWTSWQKTDGELNISGWILLLWQLPLFFFVIIFYLGRGIVTISFLKNLVGVSNVNFKPFHLDNAGGLSPIGKIGLRNQYVLATGGINIILLFIIFLSFEYHPLIPLLIISVALYIAPHTEWTVI